jgi:NitT/TauT family transport system substrate-binding protein
MGICKGTKSRRDFLRRAGVAAAAAALPGTLVRPLRAAGPLRPVKMLLDWLYQGPNDGFMVARDKGYYEAAGLDVAIDSGKGS